MSILMLCYIFVELFLVIMLSSCHLFSKAMLSSKFLFDLWQCVPFLPRIMSSFLRSIVLLVEFINSNNSSLACPIRPYISLSSYCYIPVEAYDRWLNGTNKTDSEWHGEGGGDDDDIGRGRGGWGEGEGRGKVMMVGLERRGGGDGS